MKLQSALPLDTTPDLDHSHTVHICFLSLTEAPSEHDDGVSGQGARVSRSTRCSITTNGRPFRQAFACGHVVELGTLYRGTLLGAYTVLTAPLTIVNREIGIQSECILCAWISD